MAIDIFNQIVDLRFNVFEHFQVLRNDDTHLIDGLVGYKHQYLENTNLFDYDPSGNYLVSVQNTPDADYLSIRDSQDFLDAVRKYFLFRQDNLARRVRDRNAVPWLADTVSIYVTAAQGGHHLLGWQNQQL